LVWGISPAWRDDQQEEIRRSSCERGFISNGVGFYLQESTLGVHEMDDSVEKLHDALIRNLYYNDALLTDDMQRASGAFTRLDSKWSKWCFTLIRMAWDPNIEGLFHDRILLGIGMTQWHI